MSDPNSQGLEQDTARVRSLMLDYVDRVAGHFGFVRVEQRPEHERLRALLGSPQGEALLHEVQLAVARRPEQLTGARNHAELLLRIDDLLSAALSKVERDHAEAELYAEASAEELDPDPVFRRAANKSASKTWPS